VRSLTINQFLNNLAGQVSSLTGLPKDQIRTELAHYSTTDGLTRQWSKYAMGSLRMPGTPALIVNGVRVDGGTDMDASKLAAFIKALL
jgi:protein-disulfide isomerase